MQIVCQRRFLELRFQQISQALLYTKLCSELQLESKHGLKSMERQLTILTGGYCQSTPFICTLCDRQTQRTSLSRLFDPAS